MVHTTIIVVLAAGYQVRFVTVIPNADFVIVDEKGTNVANITIQKI